MHRASSCQRTGVVGVCVAANRFEKSDKYLAILFKVRIRYTDSH